ncbi:MAG: hypothetical protein EBR82_78085 [Caulobacteraceae bacterium]|nr:hypothetical protein [Caulobacteraceae bacterium]
MNTQKPIAISVKHGKMEKMSNIRIYTNMDGLIEHHKFDVLMLLYAHSTDGGKTWNPCGVVE